MTWLLYLLGVGLIGGEGVLLAIYYGKYKTERHLKEMWETQAQRMTAEIRELNDEFKIQRSSLEGALRTVRVQRDRATNRIAEVARRKPELAADLFDISLQEAVAATHGTGPQPALPTGSTPKAEPDPKR